MKAITIRNIPDDLYRSIERIARRNRRSIQQQVLLFLDKSRALDIESLVERAREIRGRLINRELGDTISEIREERSR